jgi:hypothetical protein
MASFCQTCSIAMFGEDTEDLAALLPARKYTADVGAMALCECCGPIVVDIKGKRMSPDWLPSCRCEEVGK